LTMLQQCRLLAQKGVWAFRWGGVVKSSVEGARDAGLWEGGRRSYDRTVAASRRTVQSSIRGKRGLYDQRERRAKSGQDYSRRDHARRTRLRIWRRKRMGRLRAGNWSREQQTPRTPDRRGRAQDGGRMARKVSGVSCAGGEWSLVERDPVESVGWRGNGARRAASLLQERRGGVGQVHDWRPGLKQATERVNDPFSNRHRNWTESREICGSATITSAHSSGALPCLSRPSCPNTIGY
jgi:hypothetical protein